MSQLTDLLEQSKDGFNRFDKAQFLSHIVSLDDEDVKVLFEEMEELFDSQQDLEYTLQFALNVIEDKELQSEIDSNNWVLGESLEKQIEIIQDRYPK